MTNEQLIIKLPEVEKNSELPEVFKKEAIKQVPIEDIGVVVLDHAQITKTHAVLQFLLEHNYAVITCDSNHPPVGLLLPLCVNSTQNERFRDQISASVPLQKQLWQQTIQAKIWNQALVLQRCRQSTVTNMHRWVNDVKSGDSDNLEARAAVYYWANLFDHFKRDREGEPPNNLLNYGYAILRAIVARALVSSGLLPTLGIHHHNRYNAYCLADDIMEPYRPFVDELVYELYLEGVTQLDKASKQRLLSIPVLDVIINGQRSPLMIAVGQTTASLYKCYSGELRKIAYPKVE